MHHIDDKTLTMKFYLKSRLNCLLLADYWPEEEQEQSVETAKVKYHGQIKTGTSDVDSKDNKDIVEEEEEDAVWDNLDVVKTKTVIQTGQKRKPQYPENQKEAELQKKKKRKAKQKDKP
nr:hypothetical protein BaRGS_031026 [Batillaria attramentaria]